jgi:hypothetical protein
MTKPKSTPAAAKNKEKEFDPVHTRWAIDQRAKIQHTLLALYEYLAHHDPNEAPPLQTSFVDDLIAAAFSLWRAAFLSDNQRVFETVQAAQQAFLEKVITTNAITFNDDQANAAWSFGFYMLNAMYRLKSAFELVEDALPNEDQTTLRQLLTIHIHGKSAESRYQWKQLHAALRMLFHFLNHASQLPVELPEPIPGHPFYSS